MSKDDFRKKLETAKHNWIACVDVTKFFNEHRKELSADEDLNGETPLLLSTKTNNHLLVKYFCLHRVNLESRDSDGNTALAIAVRDKKEEMAQCLIEFGANVEAAEKYKSAATPDILYLLENADEIKIPKEQLPPLKTNFSSHELETDLISTRAAREAAEAREEAREREEEEKLKDLPDFDSDSENEGELVAGLDYKPSRSTSPSSKHRVSPNSNSRHK